MAAGSSRSNWSTPTITISTPAAAEIIETPEAIFEPTEELIEPTELELLLARAAQAIEENRVRVPENDNALHYYREALTLDPVNAVAISGQRDISDVYVQEAETARIAGDPANAIAALAVAAEIDPENPAIPVANELLLAQANRELANVRLALDGGDVERAEQILSRVEQYGLIDATDIDAVRYRIEQSGRQREFIILLEAVDEDITAGRLIAPFEDNAYQTLIYLQNIYGMNPRVNAAAELLVERVLSQVIFATAAKRFAEATDMLDDVSRLGVLTAEITAARSSLQRAMDNESNRSVAASNAADPSPANLAPPTNDQALAGGLALRAGQPASLVALPVNSTIGQDKKALAAANDPVSVMQIESTSDQAVSVADLDIEKYVLPTFPLGAQKDGITGYVELQFDVNTDGSTGNLEVIASEPSTIFVRSARNAVNQWRFAKRDQIVTAQVTMRFDWEPE